MNKKSEHISGADKTAPRGTLASRVYDRLRQDILRGLLSPGKKLRTEYLRTRYEVGNTPLREALNRLSVDGLVTRIDQRGFSVSALNHEEYGQLLKVRCWLEEIALRESIKNRTQEWEENLVIALHRLSRVPALIDDAPNAAWEDQHHYFHKSLIANCGSDWLISFCNQLLDQTDRYRQFAFTAHYAERDLLQEHTAIFDAAVEGDTGKAVDLLVAHYRRTGKQILETDMSADQSDT